MKPTDTLHVSDSGIYACYSKIFFVRMMKFENFVERVGRSEEMDAMYFFVRASVRTSLVYVYGGDGVECGGGKFHQMYNTIMKLFSVYFNIVILIRRENTVGLNRFGSVAFVPEACVPEE